MKRKRKAKRGGGDLTGSAQNRIVCKDEWASGHLLGDSNKDMWTGLSDELKLYLSRSVASITLCDGLDQDPLVRNLTAIQKIEVLLKLNDQDQYGEGTLEHYSLHYNVALVNIKDYSTPRPLKALLDCKEPDKVVVVGRCFESGTLMATYGELVSWSGTLDCDYLVRSTCKISKVACANALLVRPEDKSDDDDEVGVITKSGRIRSLVM
nr:unnamed protein product [Digitaria exilis]